MSRLIYADKLMADINRQPLGGWQKQTVRCVINEQPTAYDVDGVMNELDSAVYSDTICDLDGWEINEDLLKADMVKDIVKRGGVE